MRQQSIFPPYLILGFAIFSMFFGAGNVIYPMALGVHSGLSALAWIGFMLTAIGAPLLGLFAILQSEGQLQKIFTDIDLKGASFWMLILVLALGPIGATPRCVLLSYQAFYAIFPWISLPLFTMILGMLLYFLCLHRGSALAILGKFLSPALLVLLLTIASLSIFYFSPGPEQKSNIFDGLQQGYQTMDLLASLLFGVTIWRVTKHFGVSSSNIYSTYLKASLIGAGLLALVYFCLGFAAHAQSGSLLPVSQDLYLNTLSAATLGTLGAKISSLIIFLACMTTIVALIITCTDTLMTGIIKTENKKYSGHYKIYLGAMLTLTMLCSNLGFEKISHVINFCVTYTYPFYILIAASYLIRNKIKLQWANQILYTVLAGYISIHTLLKIGM